MRAHKPRVCNLACDGCKLQPHAHGGEGVVLEEKKVLAERVCVRQELMEIDHISDQIAKITRALSDRLAPELVSCVVLASRWHFHFTLYPSYARLSGGVLGNP